METKFQHPAAPLAQEAKKDLHAAAGAARKKLSEGAAFVREHPSETAIAGVGLGFLLAHLPLRFLIGSALRLALLLAKPAALIYGAVKLREAFRHAK